MIIPLLDIIFTPSEDLTRFPFSEIFITDDSILKSSAKTKLVKIKIMNIILYKILFFIYSHKSNRAYNY